MPPDRRPARTQITVPVGADGKWVDSGRWRELGVTHWHLVRREWGRFDPERFDSDRARADRDLTTHGVARSPQEVADWLLQECLHTAQACPAEEEMLRSAGLDSPDGRRLFHEVRFWGAMNGRDVAAIQGAGPSHLVDLNAYAATAACRRH